MEEGGLHRDQAAKTRRQAELAPARFTVQATLRGYSPGIRLWSHIMPGHESDFEVDTFKAAYCETIPLAIADQIDGILIDWLKDPDVSCQELVVRVDSIIAELEVLHQQLANTSDYQPHEDMVPSLVESLLSIRDDVLPDRSQHEAFSRVINKIRAYYNPGLSQDCAKRPLGRG